LAKKENEKKTGERKGNRTKGRTEGPMTTKGREYQKHLKRGKVEMTLQY
jgi:hypothetical protein